jgi:gamma-glutamyltranspeptidase/glutathione hydrolase
VAPVVARVGRARGAVAAIRAAGHLSSRRRGARAGTIFRNPDLARSLRLVAAHGRDAFYRGPIADAIVSLSQASGGTMTAADLSSFEPEWVEPVSTTYRGWTVYELPPNTQGIAALMMLDLMETSPLARYGFHSVDALHTMIEAKKLAYADMLRWVGDPRFARRRCRAAREGARGARAQRIDMQRRRRTSSRSARRADHRRGGDTVYLSAIDRDGNIVSLIQSIFGGFGSGLVAPGTGFALQNRGALFTLDRATRTSSRRASGRCTRSSRLHAQGRRAHRLRHHGRLQPGAGARAVRGQRRRLRPDIQQALEAGASPSRRSRGST